MGFLGYCAIIWLCFPPWPYMYAGCGGEQGTDSLSELVLLVCIAWLPKCPGFLLLPAPSSWEWGARELFSNKENNSSTSGLSRRGGRGRGRLWLPVAQGAGKQERCRGEPLAGAEWSAGLPTLLPWCCYQGPSAACGVSSKSWSNTCR